MAANDGNRPDFVVRGVEAARVVLGEEELGVAQPSALIGPPLFRLSNCGEPTTVERAERARRVE